MKMGKIRLKNNYNGMREAKLKIYKMIYYEVKAAQH